ncbi:hypothetical protein PsorP6_017819 [Peronosclerospora sorghi]|uniref:Uncharacterized protein n=1 Tax=Peronosclerospora sorghi TaxID=230839 RepID=A0ACC0WCC9_9STRA|nr:hypothetical protein PsorP6_017819 [Peronosclerospora sorghi]
MNHLDGSVAPLDDNQKVTIEPPTNNMLERGTYPKTKPLLSHMVTKHIIGQYIYQLAIFLINNEPVHSTITNCMRIWRMVT